MFYHYTWGFAIPTSHIPIIFIFSYYSFLAAVLNPSEHQMAVKGKTSGIAKNLFPWAKNI